VTPPVLRKSVVEMAAGKLRNILGSMEFGRRNLTVDAPVLKISNLATPNTVH